MFPPPEATVPSEDFDNGASVTEVQSENSDVNNDTNAGPPRRTAWNRPSNGVVEAGSVMGGAVSWPALSESTRPVTRSSPDVSRPLGNGSATSSQAPAVSPSSQRQANTNSQSNFGPNHHRQRSRIRNGAAGGGGNNGGNSSANGPPHNNPNRPLTPVPPNFSTFFVPYQFVQPALDTSASGIRPVRAFGGTQSQTGSDHSSNRNSSRRVNYVSQPHAEGQYHNNHGGRRDQDRRDVHVIPPYITPPMRFLPPPMPPAGPFVPPPPPPPPMAIFPPMGFDMSSTMMYPPTMSPDSFGPFPMMPPPFPFYIPSFAENPLTGMIVRQIDYYFSDDNLIKDNFLRANMDENGWVPIILVASFPRVQRLTKDIPTILESLRYSTVVEVEGEKLRRHNDWKKWLFPGHPSSNHSTSSEDALAASLQGVSLNSAGEEGMPREDSSATHTPSDSSLRSELINGGDNSAAAAVQEADTAEA